MFSMPVKLLGGISGALEMKESYFLSINVLLKHAEGISEMVNAKVFKPLPLCSAPLKTLLVGYFWSSRNESKPLSIQNVFEKMLRDISEEVNAVAFKPLPLCSAPLKTLLVGIIGALKIKQSYFLSINVF